jgi:1-acyl-sn-glycerol-3-phosphate acyltransferase
MNKWNRRIYTYFAGASFLLTFFTIFPFFLTCIWVPSWKKWGRKINRIWAKVYFSMIFLPVQVKTEQKLKKNVPYIFLANHFSYLDVAMMGFIPGDVLFVGKASIRKIPFFGYYFKKLHIAVERSNVKSRAETMRRAAEALENGSGIVLFPEGGIYTDNPPYMVPFKDGAFRLSMEKQIPIIPVTLSSNHVILPNEKEILFRRTPAKMVIHAPLHPHEFESLESLKSKCFEVIQRQLLVDNPESKVNPSKREDLA